MLTLFRGDDLAFAEVDRKVCVRFNTCQDLTGWAAKFCLLDNVKQTEDISSRIWTFGYTAEETQLFPLGKTFGKLVIIDQSGRIRQMSRVEVEVVNQKLEPCIAGLIAISVDNVVADYLNMGNKPILNGKTIEGSHDSRYYDLAPGCLVPKVHGLADTVQMMSATVTDQGEAIANNYVKLVALKEQVDNLPPVIDYSTEIANLGNRITQETAERASADESLESRISEETESRQESIEKLITGQTLVSRLLFTAEGDNDNYYRIKVVMRPDGEGGQSPTFSFAPIPRSEVENSGN